MHLIECKNLSKSYGSIRAIQDVSFSLQRGEIIVLVGRSGCGKTTLLKNLALLEKPDTGTIYFDGQLVFCRNCDAKNGKASFDPKSYRSKFGFVFQRFALWPHMTALKNVSVGLRVVKKLNKKKANETALFYLQKVHVEHRKDALPEQLSGGEAQRVAIARALALEPEIICLDEITSALDPEQTAGILRIIKKLSKDEKVSMIIVTHHIEFALNMAHRVIFMEQGHVLEEGPPQEILSRPKTKSVQLFIDAIEVGR